MKTAHGRYLKFNATLSHHLRQKFTIQTANWRQQGKHTSSSSDVQRQLEYKRAAPYVNGVATPKVARSSPDKQPFQPEKAPIAESNDRGDQQVDIVHEKRCRKRKRKEKWGGCQRTLSPRINRPQSKMVTELLSDLASHLVAKARQCHIYPQALLQKRVT